MKVKRFWTLLGVFILFLLIASGCAVNKETMNAYNEAKEVFQKATLIGAKKCAPCQYATAEAYIAIADHEVKDYWREIENLDNHIKIVKEKSLEAIRICEKPPTPPVVAPPPPPPAVVAPPPAPPPPIVVPPPAPPPPVVAPPPPKEEFPPPTPPTLPPQMGPPSVLPPPEPPPVAVAPGKPAPPPAPAAPPPAPPTPAPAPVPPAPPKPPVAPVFEPVYFDINKSNISPTASKSLDKNGMILKDNPQIKVIIEGHADSTGSERLNQILSEKRAESAKKYLIDKFNIQADRLKTKGYGSKRPIADNATKEGRAKNRRVEFRIIP